MTDIIEKAGIEKGSRVLADKGYSSKGNRSFLTEHTLKYAIMHKAVKNKPITNHQQKFNKLVSKTRFKIERTFGSMVRWFKAGVARYIGKAKTHPQHLMEAIAYNLYRSPGIVVPNAKLLGN